MASEVPVPHARATEERLVALDAGLEGLPTRVLTGVELDRLDDAQLALQVASVDVFARTPPRAQGSRFDLA